MNKNDSGVVFPGVGKRSCDFHEIRNIECDENPVLLSRQPKHVAVLERLHRGIARSGHHVMSTLAKRHSHRWRHVSVK
jgi:hypothetical protein